MKQIFLHPYSHPHFPHLPLLIITNPQQSQQLILPSSPKPFFTKHRTQLGSHMHLPSLSKATIFKTKNHHPLLLSYTPPPHQQKRPHFHTKTHLSATLNRKTTICHTPQSQSARTTAESRCEERGVHKICVHRQ